MAQDTTGLGHWPTTVARDGGKATFSGVARAGKALSGWVGDHRQLGRGAGSPAHGRRLHIKDRVGPVTRRSDPQTERPKDPRRRWRGR